MSSDPSFIVELLESFVLPLVTAVAGWFANVWRTKQKKEADVLTNVTQILEMQKQYITEQDMENKKTRDMNRRLEKKLDDKRESIRKANKCQFTNEGDGCPVLANEDKNDNRCKDCKLNCDADSED